jgi:hypothetical protein
MFLRKDATKLQVIRVDEIIRKTTIYAKIALLIEKDNELSQSCDWLFGWFGLDSGMLHEK